MEKLSKLTLVILASIFLHGCYVNAQTTKVVTKCKMLGWHIDNNSELKISFIQPPGKARKGGNGLEFRPTGDKPVRIRLAGYNNTLLKDITELKYSARTKSEAQLTAFLALQVEFTTGNPGAGTKIKERAILVFEPRFQASFQGPVITEQWKEWNCLKGVWWLNYNTPDSKTPFTTPSAPFYTLNSFATEYPDAKLISTDAGEPIRLSAGGGDVPIVPDLICFANNFTIGIKGENTITYRFEYRTSCRGTEELWGRYKILIVSLVILIPAIWFFVRRNRQAKR